MEIHRVTLLGITCDGECAAYSGEFTFVRDANCIKNFEEIRFLVTDNEVSIQRIQVDTLPEVKIEYPKTAFFGDKIGFNPNNLLMKK